MEPASLPTHTHTGEADTSPTSALFCFMWVEKVVCLSANRLLPCQSPCLPFRKPSSPSTGGWYRRYLHILANSSAPSKALHLIGLGLHQSLGVAPLTEGVTLAKVAGYSSDTPCQSKAPDIQGQHDLLSRDLRALMPLGSTASHTLREQFFYCSGKPKAKGEKLVSWVTAPIPERCPELCYSVN